MYDFVQADFRSLKSEVVEFMRNVPSHDPDRMMVDVWFDRVERSVNEIDNDYQKKNDQSEVIKECAQAAKEVVDQFDTYIEAAKKEFASSERKDDTDFIKDLFAEIKEEIESLAHTLSNAAE